MSRIDDLKEDLKYYTTYGDSRHRFIVNDLEQEINMRQNLKYFSQPNKSNKRNKRKIDWCEKYGALLAMLLSAFIALVGLLCLYSIGLFR